MAIPPFSIDEELDLHGLAIDEAMVQVELLLNRYKNHKKTIVRIIHGYSSGKQNSIQGALKRNLNSIWKGKILSHKPEPGNPGSTLILLGKS